MTTPTTPDCMKCKHFDHGNDTANTCAAFPKGIPVKVIVGDVSHRRPLRGDHGITFELDPARATR